MKTTRYFLYSLAFLGSLWVFSSQAIGATIAESEVAGLSIAFTEDAKGFKLEICPTDGEIDLHLLEVKVSTSSKAKGVVIDIDNSKALRPRKFEDSRQHIKKIRFSRQTRIVVNVEGTASFLYKSIATLEGKLKLVLSFSVSRLDSNAPPEELSPAKNEAQAPNPSPVEVLYAPRTSIHLPEKAVLALAQNELPEELSPSKNEVQESRPSPVKILSAVRARIDIPEEPMLVLAQVEQPEVVVEEVRAQPASPEEPEAYNETKELSKAKFNNPIRTVTVPRQHIVPTARTKPKKAQTLKRRESTLAFTVEGDEIMLVEIKPREKYRIKRSDEPKSEENTETEASEVPEGNPVAVAPPQAQATATKSLPPAAAQAIPGLLNTVWEGRDSEGDQYKYEFKAGGKLVYTTKFGTFEGAHWRQEGNKLFMSMNNGFSQYKGIIQGRNISGNAWNSNNKKWTWKAVKQ